GVAAIANGVNAFRRPQSRNAAQTLLILLGVSITLFLGVSWLAIHMHARPSTTTSVISQIGKAAFGGGVFYYLLQGFTFAIPLFVLGFYGVRRHYLKVARRLRAGAAAVTAAPPATNRVVLQVEDLNDATRRALWYARQIAEDFTAVRLPHEGRRDPRGYWWD